MNPLRLEPAVMKAIFVHARETHPEECCGAVLRRPGGQAVVRFTNIQNRLHEAHPDENPRDARTAYTPETKELYGVLREADQPGCELLAFYHSHAVNGSYFSGEDRARAMFGDDPAYPEVSYLVASDARTPGELRAFRWEPSSHDFVEQPLAASAARGAARPTKPALRRRGAKARPKAVARKRKTASPARKTAARKTAARSTRAKKRTASARTSRKRAGAPRAKRARTARMKKK